MVRSWPRRRSFARSLALSSLCLGLLIGPLASSGSAATESPSEASTCASPTANRPADEEGLVPAQSLAQGNVFDHGPPKSLLIVSSKPDPIAMVVAPSSAEAVANVDFSSNLLVGLFIGKWPQDGHQVTIESVRATGDSVCITATVIRPGPGEDASDAETYPYHVVTVPRAALPLTAGTTWTAVSPDGAVLASTKFP